MGWIALGLAALLMIGAAGWYVAGARVETPAHVVERQDGRIEIRCYPAMLAAGVQRPGDRSEAVRAAFGPLARYIFGRDRGPGGSDEKIAMTAPVLQLAESGGWRVRFLMPAGSDLTTLPAPAGDVALERLPAQRVAAIRFSGGWTDMRFDRARATLGDWLAANGLAAAGPPVFAYYNDPFTPGFLRRNEVLIPLASD